jgi:hypothetical protein
MGISCGVLSSTDNMLPLSAIKAYHRQYIAYMLTKQERKEGLVMWAKKPLLVEHGATIQYLLFLMPERTA